MASFQRPNRLFLLVIFCLSTVLAACSSGGGGKGGSSQGGGDTRPDNFTITTPNGVDPTKVAFNAPIVSAPVTIAGIDTAAPVSISGGQFSIDGGTFTSTASTVRNGQRITVRVQSPVKAGQTVTATLSVGGFAAPFTVTTQADTTPPEVAILFPPPASMTEGATLFVRGTVRDVHGTLKATGAVLVNGVAATLERNGAGDEATWSVTLPLEMGENEIVVIAEDASSNINDDESVNSRRVASIAGESFPDNEVPFSEPISLDIHVFDETPVALITDPTAQAIIAVDLMTGKRGIFSDNEMQADNSLEYPWNIHVGENGQTYVFDWDVEQPRIYELDGVGKRGLFVQKDEGENSIDRPFGMFLRESSVGSYLYLADRGSLLRVDVQTKNQVVISDSINGVPNFDHPIAGAVGLAFDKKSEQFFVISVGEEKLYSVDVITGQRRAITIDEPLIISDGAILPDGNTFVAIEATENRVSMINLDSGSVSVISGSGSDSESLFREPRGAAVSHSGGYVLVVDRILKSIVALDLKSYQQVIVSKSE